MKFGYYSDKELPKSWVHKKLIKKGSPTLDYKINSQGYRCPEFNVPDGKKNVAILGCSHTFGVGLDSNEHWVHFLSQHNTERLRYWNLAQPGASADKIVRILYGAEKVIFPNIIIMCWPFWGRRERLDAYAQSLMSYDEKLKDENENTDRNNFLKNVFFVEKFAEQNQCKTFHCFAQDSYHKDLKDVKGLNILETYTIKNCWPWWDSREQREPYGYPSLARDGVHYGIDHHKRFAELFLARFGRKLR